jgi:hypothetical protein
MAAGLGFKDFVTGEVLTAADVDGYLMQGIWVFASAAARDAAVTAPAEGNFAFTKDTNSLWYYDGAAWVASGATGDIEGVTAGTGISGGGTSGTVTITNSMATAIDAKGDLIGGTGADTFARLAVGANDTVLTADSTAATGLKWAAPAGAGITYADWTPTLVNFTKGNGTFNFRYAQSGKAVFLDINIIFGSTTSMQASTISLPVAPKYYKAMVPANYLDAGTAFYSAACTIESAGGVDVLSLKAQKSDATYTTLVGVDTAVPFTWTTNDEINIQCVYEAA